MDEIPFLRLLLDEAPAAAFEEELRRGHGRELASDQYEALQEAGYLATQLRLVLRERRRREAELAALFATAGDLTAIRDPQQVLRAIVGRARQLLEADTAYLTLIDEQAGDTYMRVTEGTITTEFGELRLPLGVGLGGLVAETSMPHFTSDYLVDDAYNHNDEIDTAVAGEGLRAILGVPLILVDKVIGVLFVANRHPRPFISDEVNLLLSLGAHAAIVIENARLFDQATRALDEVNRANELLLAHSRAVERAAAAHERLTNLVVQGGSLEQVVAAVAQVLETHVVVLDPGGQPLTAWAPNEVQPQPPDLSSSVVDVFDRGTMHVDGEPGWWLSPIAAAGDQLGVLVLRGSPDLGDADLRTLERAAQATALVLLAQRAVDDAEARMRGELLDDLVAEHPRDQEVTRRRAQRLGVDLDRPYHVVVVSGEAGQRSGLRAAALAMAAQHAGLVSVRQDTVVLLLPADAAAGPGDGPEDVTTGRPESTARRPAGRDLGEVVAAELGGEVIGGVARAGTVDGIRDAFRAADRTRRALVALGRVGAVAREDDLGAHALLLNHTSRDDLTRFVRRAIGPVLDYDEQRGTDLAATLQAYFAAAGNVTRAAAALHVHVNTFYQRCDRISTLLGDGWQDADESLTLHLALEIRRLGDVV